MAINNWTSWWFQCYASPFVISPNNHWETLICSASAQRSSRGQTFAGSEHLVLTAIGKCTFCNPGVSVLPSEMGENLFKPDRFKFKNFCIGSFDKGTQKHLIKALASAHQITKFRSSWPPHPSCRILRLEWTSANGLCSPEIVRCCQQRLPSFMKQKHLSRNGWHWTWSQKEHVSRTSLREVRWVCGHLPQSLGKRESTKCIPCFACTVWSWAGMRGGLTRLHWFPRYDTDRYMKISWKEK